jgi:carboxyl-terminal processing protease
LRIDRRALIAATAMTAVSGVVAGSEHVSVGGQRLPDGLWRSRRSAELVAVGKGRCRRFVIYDRALALVADDPLGEVEGETLEARLTNEGRLELERWGQVTRFAYDLVPDWPPGPRYGDDRSWSRDADVTVDAFFQLLSEHFAFAAERGLDWTALRAGCDAALDRDGRSPESLFGALAGVLGALHDGHGWLEGGERSAESRGASPRAVQAWRAAGGRASEGDYWDGFFDDGAKHVRRRILAGEDRSAADEGLFWGRLASGAGYMALMRCEGFSSDEGGRRDVAVIEAALERALGELSDARGMVVDLRLNPGGWDRVALALAGRFADSATPAFTKHAMRWGAAVEPQAVATIPAASRRHTGPVAVLTCDATLSAGEVAVLALRALPNVRTFGWPTYGALSDELPYRLPNGWEGTISNEVYTAADGQVYENRGVPPAQVAAELSSSDFWSSFDAPLRDAEVWLASGGAG